MNKYINSMVALFALLVAVSGIFFAAIVGQVLQLAAPSWLSAMTASAWLLVWACGATATYLHWKGEFAIAQGGPPVKEP